MFGKPINARKTIWFHGASLGEIKQAESIAHDLHENHGYDILITTFTDYGARWVEKAMPYATHRFFPADLGIFHKQIIRKFQPELAVILEGDLWPAQLRCLKNNKVPTALLNIRASKSRRKHPKLSSFLLRHFDLISAASPELLDELGDLGIPAVRTVLSQNLKSLPQTHPISRADVIDGFVRGQKFWIAASTHESDEDVVLTAAKAMTNARLVWAPRHMERVGKISKALGDAGLDFDLRSQAHNPQSNILVLDTIGELTSVFKDSFAVYLGGGFGDEGGHNPSEPAQFGIPILSGPKVDNHAPAFETLEDQSRLSFVHSANDLITALEQLQYSPISKADRAFPVSSLKEDIAYKALLHLLEA